MVPGRRLKIDTNILISIDNRVLGFQEFFETGVYSALARRSCLQPNAITAARWHLNEFKANTLFPFVMLNSF